MRHRKLFLECVGYLGYLVILSRLPINFLGNLQRHLANLGKRGTKFGQLSLTLTDIGMNVTARAGA